MFLPLTVVKSSDKSVKLSVKRKSCWEISKRLRYFNPSFNGQGFIGRNFKIAYNPTSALDADWLKSASRYAQDNTMRLAELRSLV